MDDVTRLLFNCEEDINDHESYEELSVILKRNGLRGPIYTLLESRLNEIEREKLLIERNSLLLEIISSYQELELIQFYLEKRDVHLSPKHYERRGLRQKMCSPNIDPGFYTFELGLTSDIRICKKCLVRVAQNHKEKLPEVERRVMSLRDIFLDVPKKVRGRNVSLF